MSHVLDSNTVGITGNIDWKVIAWDNGDVEPSADLAESKGMPEALRRHIQDWLDSNDGQEWVLDLAATAGALHPQPR